MGKKDTMHRRAITIILLLLLGVSNLVFAQEQKFPPRFQAVVDYLMNDEYPELFGDNPYVMRPTGFDIGDLDSDGVDEVVVSFYPHFRQSPTIMIFKVDNEMKVTRITEGLAPGKLVPVTDEYFDSHATGYGIDLTTDEAINDPKKREDLIKIMIENMGNVVAYKNFIHSDGRKGNGTYIDMMHIENPPKDKTCESFEFPRVEHVQIGSRTGDPTPVIMALAGDEVYFYKIKAIRPDGLLDKTIDVVPMDE
jgi:hypothetical protein